MVERSPFARPGSKACPCLVRRPWHRVASEASERFLGDRFRRGPCRWTGNANISGVRTPSWADPSKHLLRNGSKPDLSKSGVFLEDGRRTVHLIEANVPPVPRRSAGGTLDQAPFSTSSLWSWASPRTRWLKAIQDVKSEFGDWLSGSKALLHHRGSTTHVQANLGPNRVPRP